MRFSYYKKNIYLSSLLALFSLCACDLRLAPPDTPIVRAAQSASEEASPQDKLPKDFIQFYDRFHTDELYQLEHIIWPLPGRIIESDEAQIQLTSSWAKEDWTLHKKISLADSYDLMYETTDEYTVQEIIMNRIVQRGILRRWNKINDHWFMTYYSGLQTAEQLSQL